eukprot:NODE_974_length_640_cov_626.008460_g902_i0.p1 GENE.NODE_974_length_640_cov_626.008460_g902_i0~~NODE_974_length_640_cov_626.008460_g902_i0.p1  ORF type:complete len:138 (+),score=50.02 NODE_974_length_640_cov_626.008460_g902_i0:95-508(+)
MSGKKEEKKFFIRTKQFMNNRLLQRKQFVVEVEYSGSRGTIPKKEIQAKLAKMFNITDDNTIVLYGFHVKFGGGKAVGFGLIYDNITAVKRFEPRYRQTRLGLTPKKEGSRKQKKEKKNRQKKVRGVKKAKMATKKK